MVNGITGTILIGVYLIKSSCCVVFFCNSLIETQLEDGFHLIFLIIKNYMRVVDGNKHSFVFSFADDEATFFFSTA